MKDKILSILKNEEERTRYIVLFAMCFNFIWSGVKIFLGLFLSSLFFVITGVYTMILGFSKKVFYTNRKVECDKLATQKSVLIGVFVIITSILFILNMCSLFFTHQEYNYNLIVSISIAAGSFWEIGFAIYRLIKVRKRDNVLLVSYTASTVVSGVFAIVATQIALLASCGVEGWLFNGITGSIFGAFALMIGIFMIINAKKNLKTKAKHKNF